MTQWTDFVKQYAKENNLSYRESLKQAGQHYKNPLSSKPKMKPKYKRVNINIIQDNKVLPSPQKQMPSVVTTHSNQDNKTIQVPPVQPIIQQQQQQLSNTPTINPVQQLKLQISNQHELYKSMMNQINSTYKNKSKELMMSKLNLKRGDIKNKINELRVAFELQKKELTASQAIVNKTLLNKLNSISHPQLYIRV
jgi:hypothetical protein